MYETLTVSWSGGSISRSRDESQVLTWRGAHLEEVRCRVAGRRKLPLACLPNPIFKKLS